MIIVIHTSSESLEIWWPLFMPCPREGETISLDLMNMMVNGVTWPTQRMLNGRVAGVTHTRAYDMSAQDRVKWGVNVFLDDPS